MLDLWTVCFMIFITINSVKLIIDVIAISKSINYYKRRSRSRKNIITYNGHEDLDTWPHISIIKPICIDSPKIKRLIETHYQIDYPSYDIHFCFQSKTNSCIEFISQISKKYPRIKTYVHSDANLKEYGNNKIINISQGYNKSNGEYIWVVDENVKCQITVLKELITQFDHKDVALVHQLPLIKNYKTLDSAITMVYPF
ncbi:Ceramide glucosyltransferase [Thelohanellus kitauei]|uniref:ceramide glucosyltransferase n=1 Tax=Thelohanellus kitauei TaxID=669202 RepID=A0A0C2NLG7_THEKT|nr:Ceramide glucosyltransferase [Thelohanellus kitauei]